MLDSMALSLSSWVIWKLLLPDQDKKGFKSIMKNLLCNWVWTFHYLVVVYGTHKKCKSFSFVSTQRFMRTKLFPRSFQPRDVECRDRWGEVFASFALTFRHESCKIHSYFMCCCQWSIKIYPLNLLAQASIDDKVFMLFNKEEERSELLNF